VVSYNQPRFSPFASWVSNAITVATSATVGGTPYGLFVDTNNTLYAANRASSCVQILLEGQSIPTRTITDGLYAPFSVFATAAGDILVDNGYTNYRVDRWTSNGTNRTAVMSVKSICYDLFVDITNNLYCSMYLTHQVAAKSLNSDSNMWIVAAGTGCVGSTSNQLQYPWGIFVDRNLYLYVADCGNNRVQLFFSGQVTATTVAGNGAANTISLSCPSDVLLDADGYIFIVDSYNHRIVGSGPNGFRCLVGCSGPGSLSNQLTYPISFSFDTYGNIFVVDRDNSRIQRFNLIPDTNSSSTCPREWMNIHFLSSLLQVFLSINLCFVHQRRGIPTELHSPMQVSLACSRVVFSWPETIPCTWLVVKRAPFTSGREEFSVPAEISPVVSLSQ
jgi:hypothetical protein